ncbi:techylectin-5B-like isoform X3 [Limulus polyphemus]|uniref:Techylectin-5B-like isoform X3 n=1 Tax=Limulus polyphemus TaxID=6850 RepID=A0ABM1BZC9_LIMPO|nr:techylectin-5B-like isoform X3 [Limulus polyphemus]
MNSTREGNVLFQMICLGLTGIFLSVSVIGEKSDVSRYDLNDILNALPTTVWGMVNLVKEKLKGTLPLPESKRCDNATNFTDCADLRRRGYVESNRVYSIWPRYLNEPIKVVCDMDTEGGGWTIIQRRGYYDDKPQEFNQSWYQYSVGFGSLNDDFWLGNDKIFALTNHKVVELRVDLEDFSGTKVYAKFSYFVVLSDLRNYQMFLGSYSGDAGDSLLYHNGSLFSTKDQDNDVHAKSCSSYYNGGGGWWFKSCANSNLNGVYYKDGKASKSRSGIIWNTFGGNDISLKKTDIKIRPIYFTIPH